MDTSDLTRRAALGVGAAAVSVGVAACSSADSATPPKTTSTTGSEGSGAPSSTATGSGITVAQADVPVGGGVVLKDAKVVVTQPTAGEFKAFSAVCTHDGCLVTKIADGTIVCPCHNSVFDATSGAVVSGLARASLPQKTVTVSGTTLSIT